MIYFLITNYHKCQLMSINTHSNASNFIKIYKAPCSKTKPGK